MKEISVEPHVNNITMPDNLKVGLMIAEQRKKCASGGCNEEYCALGFGQSPFHVPPPLVSALSENAHQGRYSAAEGILELRQAISGFNKRHFNLDVDPERIVVGPGTKDVLNTLVGMIRGGVILPSPSWVGYRPQLNLLGKHFHTFHLKPEFDYRIQPEDLDKFASNLEGEQHMMVLNNPHNPTGIVYSRQELEKITEVCRKHNILVLAIKVLELFRMTLRNKFTLIHLWPHHFDFSLEWFTENTDGQIGTGISPGDEHYSEPYLYMNPYPFNEQITANELPIGTWHTSGWQGVKIEWKDLLKYSPANAVNKLHEVFEVVKKNFNDSN